MGDCLFLFIWLPIFIVTNTISLALTLALFPILVPIYMAKGDEIFTALFFRSGGTNFWFGEVSKYTILLCFWLLFPNLQYQQSNFFVSKTQIVNRQTKREMEILGAGFCRTGTMSTRKALVDLGLTPCFHCGKCRLKQLSLTLSTIL